MVILVYKFLQSGDPKYLNLSLNPDIMCIELVELNLMAYYLRSHTLHQYINLKSILASALHMMPQGFKMIFLMMYAQPNLSSFMEKLKIHLFAKAYPPPTPNFLVLSLSFFVVLTPEMFFDLPITISDFWNYVP